MKPTSKQLDILTELINIGVGRAAATLNEMIQLPHPRITSRCSLFEDGDCI